MRNRAAARLQSDDSCRARHGRYRPPALYIHTRLYVNSRLPATAVSAAHAASSADSRARHEHLPHAVIPPRARAALALLALALLAAGCKPAGGQPAAFPPPVVTVATVEPKDVPVTYEYVAQTAGYREVEVRARVTGILLKRNYTRGRRA